MLFGEWSKLFFLFAVVTTAANLIKVKLAQCDGPTNV